MSFKETVSAMAYGKRLPSAVYIFRPVEGTLGAQLGDTVRRAAAAAKPDEFWNVLKLHSDQFALTFLSYPEFDRDPHPSLAEATKINLASGTVVRTNYRNRPNPPILHRKESFLPTGDNRISVFSKLTKQEEEAGLYRDTSRIGLKIQWQTLLSRKGLRHQDHELISEEQLKRQVDVLGEAPQVDRHRTAIKRYDLSKPIKILLSRGLFQKKHSIFDYGCGHGMDVEALKSLGYSASGWDPAFCADAPKQKADVVNLGYVLNVIENPAERLTALFDAYSFAERMLLVSTLVAGQETDAHARPYLDGFLTRANTFQKFYAPGELETLIDETLGVAAVTLSLGICAAFRDPDEAELFELGRNRRRIDWTEISAQLRFSKPASREQRRVSRYELHKELFDQLWTTLLDLGRLPEVGEFDRIGELKSAAGGTKRAFDLILSFNGPEMYELARKARAEDVLVYLAMSQFRKRFLRKEIPARVKNDIRSFFGDLAEGMKRARDLLFAAGDPGEIGLAVQKLDYGVFDQQEQQFTFHRTLFSKLPAINRANLRPSLHLIIS